jgi:thioredoxin 2
VAMSVDGIVRTCASCGAKNRTPYSHLADSGNCGKCKQSLPPVAEPLDVDAAQFDEIIRNVSVPVLVDFWAEWCGPCRMAAPHVKKLAAEMAGKAVVLKVDTDAHGELAGRYEVRGIPNFLVLKDGKVVNQQAGMAPMAEMKRWLETARAAA